MTVAAPHYPVVYHRCELAKWKNCRKAPTGDFAGAMKLKTSA